MEEHENLELVSLQNLKSIPATAGEVESPHPYKIQVFGNGSPQSRPSETNITTTITKASRGHFLLFSTSFAVFCANSTMV
jgi:hypothetical protein